MGKFRPGDYAFSVGEDTLFTHLYISGKAKAPNGSFALRTETQYPYKGRVEITMEAAPKAAYTLALRLPGFSGDTKVALNGEVQTGQVEKGYMYLTRQWAPGDKIVLDIDVAPRLVTCNPRVRENLGKTALVKGPLVYCLEQADNTPYLAAVEIDPGAPIHEEERPDLLGGTMALRLKGKMPDYNALVEDAPLYGVTTPQSKDVELTAIPYCLWNNRGKGEMLVWMRRQK